MQYTDTTPRQKATNKVLDRMMEFAGHSFYYDEYVKLKDSQKEKYTITEKTLDTWSKWAVPVIQHDLKCTTQEAEIEVSWIQHNFGLTQK